MRVFAWASLISGIGAAGFWFWSAWITVPNFQRLNSFVADKTGKSPVDLWTEKVGKLNAVAAFLTAVSVLTGTIVTFSSLPN